MGPPSGRIRCSPTPAGALLADLASLLFTVLIGVPAALRTSWAAAVRDRRGTIAGIPGNQLTVGHLRAKAPAEIAAR